MESDPKVLIMGEDVGKLGGVFRITDGLQKDFGEDRVIDTPLAESGIIGTAVGLAIRGYRPVCEIQFDGFVFPGFDQIVSQVAKIHNRSDGLVRMPITIRIPFGGGIGAVEHHSESPEAYFAHTAGLKVVSCANPSDAYWMIQQSIASDDPVVFFEPKRRYWAKGAVDGRAAAAAPGPGGAPGSRPHHRDVRADGHHGARRRARRRRGRQRARGHRPALAVSPLDMPTLLGSVERTGRLIVVHEAQRSFSVSAEVAARVQEQAFYSLEAPVLRVTGYDTPYPPSRLEEEWLPNVDRILDAVDRSLAY